MAQSGSEFGLRKYGSRMVILIHPIDKKKVLAGDIEGVKSLVEIASRILMDSGVIYPWNIPISGYDLDPRSLTQIPEVVAWFRKVHENYPFLPIFLSPFVLNDYLLSQIDAEVVKVVKKTDLSVSEKKEIDAFAAILNKTEQGLGEEYRKRAEFETQYSVNMQQVRELNTQIILAAAVYFSSHEVERSIREKALRGALQRIKLTLDFG